MTAGDPCPFPFSDCIWDSVTCIGTPRLLGGARAIWPLYGCYGSTATVAMPHTPANGGWRLHAVFPPLWARPATIGIGTLLLVTLQNTDRTYHTWTYNVEFIYKKNEKHKHLLSCKQHPKMIPKLWTVRRSSLIIWSRSSCQLWSFHHNWKAQRCEARCIRRIWQSKKSQEGTKASSGNQEPPRTHNSDTQIPYIYIKYIYIYIITYITWLYIYTFIIIYHFRVDDNQPYREENVTSPVLVEL